MKKLVLMLAAVATMGISASDAVAQTSFSINIGSQPAWGPSGYEYARYYYIPDIDAYYDVPNQLYVFNSNGNWISSRALPSSYNFNPYNSYKVVINDPTPWRSHDRYRAQYAQYRGRTGQTLLYTTDPRFMNDRSRSWGGYNRNHDRYQYDRYKGRTWDDEDHLRRKGWEKKDKD
jgi:hypothetical protein